MKTDTIQEASSLPGYVVARMDCTPRRGWLGALGDEQVEVPRATWVYRVDGASSAGEEMTGQAGARVKATEGVAFWLVNERPFPVFLSLDAVARDRDGAAWDLILEARVWVRDPRRLLVPNVLCLVEAHRPLTPEGLGSWLRERLTTHMQRRLADEAPERWRDPSVRGLESWQAEINEVLMDLGVEGALVSRPTWSSPSAEAAEARRAAEEARTRKESAEARERECQELELAHEVRLESLTAGRERAATAASHLLEAERRKARHAAEVAEAEHRVALAQYETLLRREQATQAELQADIETAVPRRLAAIAAEERLEAAKDAERRVQARDAEVNAAVDGLVAAATALGAKGQALDEALRRLELWFEGSGLGGRIETLMNSLLETLDRMDGRASAGRVDRAGFDALFKGVPAMTFYRRGIETRPVRVTTRDIGGRRDDGVVVPGRPIEPGGMATVWVGDAVDLELTSPVRGCLTLINLGTSGSRWLIVPHAISSPGAVIEAGSAQRIPGSDILPWSGLRAWGFRDLGAAGPDGEERFIALVTATPLIRPNDPRLVPAAPGTLFAEVPGALWEGILEGFRKEPMASKAAGLLRYRIRSRPDCNDRNAVIDHTRRAA